MMIPDERRRCSALEFANTWLKQQQAKQQQGGNQDLQDASARAGGIRAQHDQTVKAPVLVGAV